MGIGNANINACIENDILTCPVYYYSLVVVFLFLVCIITTILRIFAYHFSVQFLTTAKNWYCVGVRVVGFSIKVMHNELLLMFVRWFLICKITYTQVLRTRCSSKVNLSVYLFFLNINLVLNRFWNSIIQCNLSENRYKIMGL